MPAENKQLVMVGGKTYRQVLNAQGQLELFEVLPTPPETTGQEK